jgi:hypothetical protein
MPSEKENNCILLGKRETIRFLKEKKMDIMEISRALMRKPGAEPEDYWQKIAPSWSFSIQEESSLGMKVCFCTKYVSYAIPFFEFLINKLPDLYIRAEYHHHNRDCCYEGFWVGRTVDGKPVIKELFWEDENVHGCYAAPDAYSPYWYWSGGNKYQIFDDQIILENPTEEKIILECLKWMENHIRSLYDGIFFRVLDEIKETYETTEKTPAILEILNKLGPLGDAKKADMILEEEENKKRQEKWEKERQTKTDGNNSDDVEPIPVPKKRTIVKKVIKKKTQV